MTCGSEIGNSEKGLRALCPQMGLDYRGVLELVMPENYIALFSAPDRTGGAGHSGQGPSGAGPGGELDSGRKAISRETRLSSG